MTTRLEHANLRRVSNALCESPPQSREVITRSNDEAALCHSAKEQLLQAMTDEEVDQASRKVRILCQF